MAESASPISCIRLAIVWRLAADVLGLPVQRRTVLYVDYELDADEQKTAGTSGTSAA